MGAQAGGPVVEAGCEDQQVLNCLQCIRTFATADRIGIKACMMRNGVASNRRDRFFVATKKKLAEATITECKVRKEPKSTIGSKALHYATFDFNLDL